MQKKCNGRTLRIIKQNLLITVIILSFIKGSGWTAGDTQSNFSISAPPIPYPFFEEGRKDLKLTGTYVGLQATGITLSGGGANFLFRQAFNDKWAGDIQVGLYGLGGKADMDINTQFNIPKSLANLTLTSNMGFVDFPFTFALEHQFIKEPQGSLIGFAGVPLNLGVGFLNPSVTVITTVGRLIFSDTILSNVTLVNLMSGFQLGLQGSISLGDNFKLVPFAYSIYLGGSTTVNANVYDTSGYVNTSRSDSVTVPFFLQNSFGADIVYVPWDLSFGSLLQQATASGDKGGYTITVIQLSWHFRS